VTRPGPLPARGLATTLDGLVILGWLAAVAAVFVPLQVADLNPMPATGYGSHLVAFAASVLPAWLYLSISEQAAAHATWGKRRLGLRVVRHDGQPPETWRVLARNAIKLLPWQLAHLGAAPLMSGAVVAPFTIWLPLGGAYALTGLSVSLVVIRRDRAALHDLVAGTRVSAPGREASRVG
jgi:uncharacterized RDD family membrane protein YckC